MPGFFHLSSSFKRHNPYAISLVPSPWRPKALLTTALHAPLGRGEDSYCPVQLCPHMCIPAWLPGQAGRQQPAGAPQSNTPVVPGARRQPESAWNYLMPNRNWQGWGKGEGQGKIWGKQSNGYSRHMSLGIASIPGQAKHSRRADGSPSPCFPLAKGHLRSVPP